MDKKNTEKESHPASVHQAEASHGKSNEFVVVFKNVIV